MKTTRLTFLFAAVALLAGCVGGPGPERLVIETGAANPGDGDYARALAARLSQPSQASRHALSEPPALKN
jgi:hypothetical protein